MKIYINWDRLEWSTDEKQLFEDLIKGGELHTYSDFLANEYADCLDELLDLSEEEKIELYEKYEMDLKSEFEYKVQNGILGYTVLNIETNDNITVKEVL